MPVTPRLDAIFVGLGATPLPPGPDYIPITPAQAHLGFQDAITSLPANGGVLYVMPGSANYQFGEPVTVTKPNVFVDFVGGSTQTFGAVAASSLFSVSQTGFRCRGARVVHTITGTNNPDDRSCFLIQADDADISGCTFAIRQGDSSFAIRYFSCIRLLQSISTEGFRSGAKIVRNTFILDKDGVDQSEAWNTLAFPYPVPMGVTGIAAQRVRGLVVTGNVFRSSVSGTKAATGPAIYLMTTEQCAVSSNTFRDLRTSAGGVGPNRGSIVRLARQIDEGHHTVLSANAFTDIDSPILIGLDDVRYDYIAANVFDRIGSVSRPCSSVVRAENGEVLGIVGNVFSRITGTTNPNESGIYLKGLAQCTISGNTFAEVKTGQGIFATDPGTSSIVQFDVHQAQSEGD